MVRRLMTCGLSLLPKRYGIFHKSIKSRGYAFPVSTRQPTSDGLHTDNKGEIFLMAQTALVRITGKVLALPEPRSGVSKAGNPYEIATANVLVASENVTVVQLPNRDRADFRRPRVDEIVDYLCEVSLFGQNVQTNVKNVWREEHDVPALQLAAELSVSA